MPSQSDPVRTKGTRTQPAPPALKTIWRVAVAFCCLFPPLKALEFFPSEFEGVTFTVDGAISSIYAPALLRNDVHYKLGPMIGVVANR